jgi:hypothetical protein
LIAAAVFTTFAGLVLQFFIFMKTDMYAVLVTWLGCVNLTDVTRLMLAQTLPWRRDRSSDELADANLQDLRVARWYRWVYVSGILGAGWFFVASFGPNIITIAHWTLTNLTHSSPAQVEFWQALVLGSLLLSPVAVTVVIMFREHAGARRVPQRAATAPPERAVASR